MSKKNHRGGDFRGFLKEQGILGEVEARALKRAMSLQISRLLEEKSVTKAEMAARMKTSRAAVDRLLDASNSSVTLNTLAKLPALWDVKLKSNWYRHEMGGAVPVRAGRSGNIGWAGFRSADRLSSRCHWRPRWRWPEFASCAGS